MSDVLPVCLHDDPDPDAIIDFTISAVCHDATALHASLDALAVPVYLTDEEGWVTFFNRSCVDFAGRTPVPGEDRWCVTWRLYTEGGAYLPHERCPMAVAVREQRAVRGIVAVAERPDGTKVLFVPYPTPITDEGGRLIGAVNVMVDITDKRQADALRAQALRCRRLSQSITDARTVETLKLLASDYEEKARNLAK